jgi:hypothetical protein
MSNRAWDLDRDSAFLQSGPQPRGVAGSSDRPLRELYDEAEREAMGDMQRRGRVRLRHLRAIRSFIDFRGWPVLPGRTGDVTPRVAERLMAGGIAELAP